MRRMYSKEQLQKLIDEVSRLIAVEELDKVVPVPSLADAGKVMIVNEAGTGYELAAAEPLLLSNIEDSDGNKRFIEGNMINVNESISSAYAKWSLSGTHIMFVLAGTVAEDVTIADGATLCSAELPYWIANKIFAVVGNTIEYKTFISIAADYTSQDFGTRLIKSANYVSILKNGGLTLTKDRTFRLQFDLLIDTD